MDLPSAMVDVEIGDLTADEDVAADLVGGGRASSKGWQPNSSYSAGSTMGREIKGIGQFS